jgi:hypothetical protein
MTAGVVEAPFTGYCRRLADPTGRDACSRLVMGPALARSRSGFGRPNDRRARVWARRAGGYSCAGAGLAAGASSWAWPRARPGASDRTTT